jgi:hypothetical protein
MANHQASEQMIGYMYQIRYALYLLLENEDEEFNISIEKFDDIAFTKDSSNRFIQLKHHTKKYGNLTDSSTDIWRTLNVWINELKKNIELLNTTKFLIITTAKSPEKSASSMLTSNEGMRDVDTAFDLLNTIAETSSSKSHKKYYKNFMDNKAYISKKLINNIYVIDGSSSIIDTADDIKKMLRFSCNPENLQSVFERLEGWWTNKAIEALCSPTPVYVNSRQITSLIIDISREYARDNLPIDIIDFDVDEFDSATFEGQLFYEQLKLINVKNAKLKIALRDYYKAFKQRSNWVRNDLLYINELDKYERKLIDEWEHCYADMLDELDDYDEPNDEIRMSFGKNLFKEIENKDIRIRERCSEPFVMRGSYHILSNQLKVGWHADFKSRLEYLLGNEVLLSEE